MDPPKPGRTFEDALAECQTPEQYTALMRDVYDRFDPSPQKTEWLDAITETAEQDGYVVDKVGLLVSAPEVREPEAAPPEDTPAAAEEPPDETQEPTSAGATDPVDPAGDGEDEDDDKLVTVICTGPCGEEVEDVHVNEDGVCNLCVNQAAQAAPSPVAAESAQAPEQEPEPAGAPLF